MRRAARRSNSCRLGKWKGASPPLCYYVFDLLQLDGRNLRGLPLTSRKEVLQQLCAGAGDPIRYSGELGDDATALLGEVKRRGLEGIVGKLADSLYEPGRRSGAWIKLKGTNEQEFVIGGYTPPAGSRQHFGAVLVGYYEKKKLLFAGKVGSGFDNKLLAILHRKFQAKARDDCPFADLPSRQGGQWVQGITPAMMRKIHWVNPVFICQVRFSEWTREGKLRQPVFLGMRDDKNPAGGEARIASDQSQSAPASSTVTERGLTQLQPAARRSPRRPPRKPRRRHRRKGHSWRS